MLFNVELNKDPHKNLNFLKGLVLITAEVGCDQAFS